LALGRQIIKAVREHARKHPATPAETFGLYKPATVKQRRSMLDLIMLTPAASGGHVLGDSLLVDWLYGTDARDAVLRIMGACGEKVETAHRRLIALDQFFRRLLSDEPQAAEARTAFRKWCCRQLSTS
jgi:hypothetical protein